VRSLGEREESLRWKELRDKIIEFAMEIGKLEEYDRLIRKMEKILKLPNTPISRRVKLRAITNLIRRLEEDGAIVTSG